MPGSILLVVSVEECGQSRIQVSEHRCRNHRHSANLRITLTSATL
ncbi:MAG: hypothetical protein QXR62_06570 [Candidatus Bathyarchaeia archaeon]